MISESKLTEFKTLYKAYFNLEISDDEAYEKALELISVIRNTYKPILKQDYDDLQKRREKDNEANNNSIEESHGKNIPP